MNRRRTRRSPWRKVLKAFQLGLAFSAAVGSGLLAYRLVREQEYLVVKKVEVTGTEQVGAEEVLDYAQVPMGASLYRVNTESIQRAVLRHPHLASAMVQRVPPQTIAINVTEHRPVATVAVGNGVYVVNQDARMFRRTQAGEAMDLPVVTGIPRDHFQDDPARAEALLREAVAALHAHAQAGRPAAEVSEVEVDPTYGVILRLGSPLVEVVLGRGDLAGRLQRLAALEAHVKRAGQSISRVFLDNGRHPERVAVQLNTPVLAAAGETTAAAGRRAAP
ncbi:MAG: FtsQ-type POTRA domain-containing protein [Deltaproteobacteria bacterium]|nr:FtsQ-type POTRA domain-containing protein [Deltaproteobacteria bacterium]